MRESKLLYIFPHKRNHNKELELVEITIFDESEHRVNMMYEFIVPNSHLLLI